MTAFMTALLETSLAMSAVIVLLAAVNKASGSMVSAVFKRRIWLVVLIGLLVPVRPNIPLPLKPLRVPVAFNLQRPQVSEVSTETNAMNKELLVSETSGTENPSASAPAPSSPIQADSTIPYGDIVFGLWLAAAFAILLFHCWSYKRFLSSVRRWSSDAEDDRVFQALQTLYEKTGFTRKPLSIKTCTFVNSPMLIGFIHPQILLPEKGIPSDELEYVLRHEFTHYKRGDIWVNLIILLVLTIHWFNPLVYLMARFIRAESEAACDEIVVAGGDMNRRRQYGEAIIGFIGAATTKGPLLSTYFYGGIKSMKKRLISIMDTSRKSKPLAAVCAAAVLALTVLSGGVFAAAVGDEQYIGEVEAKSIAVEHAEIAEEQAVFVRAHLDYDDRRIVYDVEFFCDGVEYDYEIDAISGDILEYDRDIEHYTIPSDSNATTDAGQYIGEDTAKSTALEAAGVTESQVSFIKAYLDSDDGRVVYDIEFYSGDTEYDYEIDAQNGDIVEFDREIEYFRIPQSGSGSPAEPADKDDYIGETLAKSIALERAGADEAQAVFNDIRLDYDDGRVDYDVEFYVGNIEYEYDIDALSGSIIEYSRETENRSSRGTTDTQKQSPKPAASNDTSGYIGEASAKTIALSDAGLTESQVTRMKVSLDRDDRRMVYEVEFRDGRMEYEYEIDAVTGEIIESDSEYDD